MTGGEAGRRPLSTRSTIRGAARGARSSEGARLSEQTGRQHDGHRVGLVRNQAKPIAFMNRRTLPRCERC